MVDRPKVSCPCCSAELAAVGEVSIDDRTLGVYQCDHCLRRVDFAGEPFLEALTFALSEDGAALDAESLERLRPEDLARRDAGK